MPQPLIITIDGPAASGKSSAARTLSKQLNLPYLDSGGLYRAMAWKLLKKGVGLHSDVESFLGDVHITLRPDTHGTYATWVDSEDATPFLRDPEVTRAASILSTAPGVRRQLLSLQREIAKRGAVAEGRDMGTVVFPEAPLKFYLDASLPVRGARRLCELQAKGVSCDLATVLHDIEERDRRDRERAIAPLYPAADAVIIDSTALSLEEVVALVVSAIPHGLFSTEA